MFPSKQDLSQTCQRHCGWYIGDPIRSPFTQAIGSIPQQPGMQARLEGNIPPHTCSGTYTRSSTLGVDKDRQLCTQQSMSSITDQNGFNCKESCHDYGEPLVK